MLPIKFIVAYAYLQLFKTIARILFRCKYSAYCCPVCGMVIPRLKAVKTERSDINPPASNLLNTLTPIRTCKASVSQSLVRMSSKFMPEASAKSIGAYFPKKMEQAKLLTSDIRYEGRKGKASKLICFLERRVHA